MAPVCDAGSPENKKRMAGLRKFIGQTLTDVGVCSDHGFNLEFNGTTRIVFKVDQFGTFCKKTDEPKSVQ